jgi:hypothetical protein
VEDPLFPKESEDPKNQKRGKDQKKKTLLLHFIFQISAPPEAGFQSAIGYRPSNYCNLNFIGMVPHCSACG